MTIDWSNLILWLFALIAGITLFILSYNKKYIGWVKERIPMEEEKLFRTEKIGAIALITISVLSILRVLLIYKQG